MNVFSRIKNLWELSGLEPTVENKKVVLRDARKPQKKLATIVPDDPIDLFSNEEEYDSTR